MLLSHFGKLSAGLAGATYSVVVLRKHGNREIALRRDAVEDIRPTVIVFVIFGRLLANGGIYQTGTEGACV